MRYQVGKIFSHTGDGTSEEWSEVAQYDNYCHDLTSSVGKV
jgi:hypothetical protein